MSELEVMWQSCDGVQTSEKCDWVHTSEKDGMGTDKIAGNEHK